MIPSLPVVSYWSVLPLELEPLMNKINLEMRNSFILCHLDTFKYKMGMLVWMEAEEMLIT